MNALFGEAYWFIVDDLVEILGHSETGGSFMFARSDLPFGHAFANASHQPVAIGVLTAVTQWNQVLHFALEVPFFSRLRGTDHACDDVVVILFTCRDG